MEKKIETIEKLELWYLCNQIANIGRRIKGETEIDSGANPYKI